MAPRRPYVPKAGARRRAPPARRWKIGVVCAADAGAHPGGFTDNADITGPPSSLPRARLQRTQSIQPQQIRIDGRIRAREVRVIVAATNEQLGVMKLPDALRKAQSLGLNLVEVAPNAVPPVCRIVDFGKYRYELSKQDKEKKNAAGKLKEIKFRVNIDDHDYHTKVRRAEEFLDKGYKLNIHLQFRGREMAHQELGMALMQRVKADLNTMAHVEMEPKLV